MVPTWVLIHPRCHQIPISQISYVHCVCVCVCVRERERVPSYFDFFLEFVLLVGPLWICGQRSMKMANCGALTLKCSCMTRLHGS
jgi:hypothetical protein